MKKDILRYRDSTQPALFYEEERKIEMADDEVILNGRYISISEKQAGVLKHNYRLRARAYIKGSYSDVQVMKNEHSRNLIIKGYAVYTDDMIFCSKTVPNKIMIQKENGKSRFVKFSQENFELSDNITAMKNNNVIVFSRRRKLKDSVKVLPSLFGSDD